MDSTDCLIVILSEHQKNLIKCIGSNKLAEIEYLLLNKGKKLCRSKFAI